VKLGILFPGQASQQIGMGRDLFTEFAAVRELFQQADDVLEYSLSRLIFEGPEDELTLTANAQPAILTVSFSFWTALAPFVPDDAQVWMAGHSLGEYTALLAAGALDFVDAVRIVHLRGSLMQEAVPAGEGKMAAVVGLPQDKIEETLESLELDGEVAQLANLNSPDQVVISGSATGISMAARSLQDAGARRVVELKVSAPFHSKLMEPAAEKLKPLLDEVRFSPARHPVLANVTAEPYPDEPAAYADLLYRQVCSPVRWADTVRNIAREQPDAFAEVGPGKVLRMLAAKTVRDVPCVSVGDIEGFKGMLAFLSGESKTAG